MDNPNWSADAPDEEDQEDPVKTAETVLSDFNLLIANLERRLANLSDAENEARSHVLEARAAAERGHQLSEELIGLLRTPQLVSRCARQTSSLRTTRKH